MRGFKPFVIINRFHVFTFFFKKRILMFKRPKWFQAQKQIAYLCKNLKAQKKKRVSKRFSAFLVSLKFFKYVYFSKRKKNSKVLNKRFRKKISTRVRFSFFKFTSKLRYFLKSRKFKYMFKRNKKQARFIKFKRKFYKKKTKDFFFSFFLFNFRIFKKNSHLRFNYRYVFKNMLQMKSLILRYFFGVISLKFFKGYFKILKKKISSYKDSFSRIFLRSEFRIDILLWRLKFVKTPYFAKYALLKKKLYLNNKLLLKNREISGGDFIFFNLKFFFKKCLHHYTPSLFLPSLYEIDYYTQRIVLVKKFTMITYKDINTIIKEPLCFYKFKDYFFK